MGGTGGDGGDNNGNNANGGDNNAGDFSGNGGIAVGNNGNGGNGGGAIGGESHLPSTLLSLSPSAPSIQKLLLSFTIYKTFLVVQLLHRSLTVLSLPVASWHYCYTSLLQYLSICQLPVKAF